jgi:hypothetical protein
LLPAAATDLAGNCQARSAEKWRQDCQHLSSTARVEWMRCFAFSAKGFPKTFELS